MLCPDCEWFWDFGEDGIYCPFCGGAIGIAGPDDPPEAHEQVENAETNQ